MVWLATCQKKLSSSSTYNYQQADDYGRGMPRDVGGLTEYKAHWFTCVTHYVINLRWIDTDRFIFNLQKVVIGYFKNLMVFKPIQRRYNFIGTMTRVNI
jgi:hypothetical protein